MLVTGIPTDLHWWEYLTILPFSAALLAMPQIAMLLAALLSEHQSTRKAALATSFIALLTFFAWQSTIDLTSSSTAVLSLLFIQIILTPIALGCFALFLVLRRLFSDTLSP